jgi:hypothetical protein
VDGGFPGAIELTQIAQAIGHIPVKFDIITFIILSKTIVI